MNQLQLMQAVPWPGVLSAMRSAARHAAAAFSDDADETGRTLATQVQAAYYGVAYADRSLGVMQHTLHLLRDFREVSTTMYAVGTASQQDVLRAQVEVARMTGQITREAQDRVAAAARLNALLGRDATVAIGPVRLPEPGDVDLPPVDTLIAWAVASRPALKASDERVAAADAGWQAARRAQFPTVEFGVSYQARPEYPDMMSVMVGVNLPVFAGSKQSAQRREAAATRDMARADRASLRDETIAQLVETRARAEQDRQLQHLYESGILPQAEAAVAASLAGYRVGQVTFMQLIDNQMTVNQYDIERYRLMADYHQAAGALEALAGRPLEAPQ